MDFRILGSLEVWDGERQVELGGPKRRALLAFLVLHANEVVAADRLVDQLWGEGAPRNAAGALQTHVSRLRKELGPEVVARQAWGYVLRIDPGELDLERFERLTAEAESFPARERAGKLREALALWRGPPLDDLAFEPALGADIARLEELRMTVLENRIDADLEAGNQAGLVGELEALIAEQPLRERLRGQLILALYRSGRQAEALEVYRETRRLLAEELGLEPSPELREIERAILQQDPALRATPRSTVMVAEQGVRPGRRRRLYIGASLALLLIGLGAAASYSFATHHSSGGEGPTTSLAASRRAGRDLRWNSLHVASAATARSFAGLIAAGRGGRDPHFGARGVRSVPLPGGGHVWVAPAARGGFCEEYGTAKTANCDRSRSLMINPTFGTSGSAGCADLRNLLAGHVNGAPGAELLLAFSDGSHARLQLTWVGPPIRAGFFERAFPPGKRMTALVLRQSNGELLAAIPASRNKLFEALNERTPGPQCPHRKRGAAG